MNDKNDQILRRLDEIEASIARLSERTLTTDQALNLLNQSIQLTTEGVKKHIDRQFLQGEDRDRDIIALLLGNRFTKPVAAIQTDFPVAIASDDHKFPRGTRNDNSRHPRFVRACEKVIGGAISHLDLGCAGGGLVWDFLSSGHFSIGIEGSDFSLLERRAEWRTIPHHLFTADITKPFELLWRDSGTPIAFDVVTAWEVLEHIPEDALRALFQNIHTALRPNGLFVASVATFPDSDPITGAVWHVTIKPREWWYQVADAAGFDIVEGLFQARDFVRGSGSIRAEDWDAEKSPEAGFHLVCRARS